MPLYDYECTTCGAFRAWRSMSEHAASVECPSCTLPASRLAAAPMLAVLSSNSRIAHERNERSAHEPKVMRDDDWRRDHRHHHHRHDGDPVIKRQFGDVHKSAADRPWMVGH
jgi:putative FmdB family regulatory protein